MSPVMNPSVDFASDILADVSGWTSGILDSNDTTVQKALDSLAPLPSELLNLDDAEIQQLQNIDTVTISNTQWGYLGAMGGQPVETETDPVFTVHPAYGISSGDISNWNTAYGWGDHALAGYLVASNNLSDLVDVDTALGNLSLSTELKSLTDAEVQQFQNIDTSTISTAQWGYVGNMNQNVTQSSNVQFAEGYFTGHVGIGDSVDTDKHLLIKDTSIDVNTDYYGAYLDHTRTGGNTDYSDDFVGIFTRVSYNNNGVNIGNLYGIYSSTRLLQGDIGSNFNPRDVAGFFNKIDIDSGHIEGDVYGVYTYVDHENMNTLDGDFYGYYIWADFDGTVNGTTYMLYLEAQSGINYGVYQKGSVSNYFGGSVDVVGSITADVINEHTAGSGVTIETVLIKDGEVDGIDFGNVDDGVEGVTADEWTQIQNIDTTTISITQWGYLGSMTGQPVEVESDPVFVGSDAYAITSTQISNWDTAYGWGDHSTAGYLVASNNLSDLANVDTALGNLSLSTQLKSLTDTEVQQLQNINSTTVSTTQWGYVGNMNQNVATSSGVAFSSITVSSVTGSEKFGAGASTLSSDSTSVGASAVCASGSAVAVGYTSAVTGTGGVAVGALSDANQYSVGVGYNAQATGLRSVGIGMFASSFANYSVVVGYNSSTNYAETIVLGVNASATQTNEMMIGGNSYEIDHVKFYTTGGALDFDNAVDFSGAISAPSLTVTTLGVTGNLTIDGWVSAGQGTAGTDSEAFGSGASATGDYAVALGNGASASGEESIAIGYGATTTQANEMIVGASTYEIDNLTFIVSGTYLTWTNSVRVVGNLSCRPTGTGASSEVFGSGSSCTGGGGVVVGSDIVTTADQPTFVGHDVTGGGKSVGMGFEANAGSQGVGIGYKVDGGNNSVYIGYEAINSSGGGYHAVVIGHGAQAINGGQNTIIGYSASQNGARGVIIGKGASSNYDDCIVLGVNATGTQDNEMLVGATSYEIDYLQFIVSGTYLTWNNSVNITGDFKLDGALIVNTTRLTGVTTITAQDHAVFADSDGGAFTITLEAGVDGTVHEITNCGSSGNNITVDGNGAETINGVATQVLADGESIRIIFETTENWRIF